MAAGGTAEKTVFMLHADNIRLADIEELRRHAVVAQFVLVDLKAHFIRIRISLGFVIHGSRPAVNIGCFR
jgi:hypothetical protein